jgi:hypothetical protein
VKVYQLVEKKYIGIFSDELCKKILIEVIKKELTPMDLARILRKPILAIWKRLDDMSKANIVEVVGVKRKIGGPLLYPDTYPAFNIIKEFNIEILKNLEKYNQIPNEADPMLYSAWAFLKAFTETLRNTDLINKKLRELEELLAKIRF